MELRSTEERKAWMKVLTLAEKTKLKHAWERYQTKPSFEYLRQPEQGLVMVRARAGNSGVRFNLGEMSVTRCSVRLENGIIGHGYIPGRDASHAELAALFDALLQDAVSHAQVMEEVIVPLQQAKSLSDQKKKSETAATKVNFFTMVRGE